MARRNARRAARKSKVVANVGATLRGRLRCEAWAKASVFRVRVSGFAPLVPIGFKIWCSANVCLRQSFCLGLPSATLELCDRISVNTTVGIARTDELTKICDSLVILTEIILSGRWPKTADPHRGHLPRGRGAGSGERERGRARCHGDSGGRGVRPASRPASSRAAQPGGGELGA